MRRETEPHKEKKRHLTTHGTRKTVPNDALLFKEVQEDKKAWKCIRFREGALLRGSHASAVCGNLCRALLESLASRNKNSILGFVRETLSSHNTNKKQRKRFKNIYSPRWYTLDRVAAVKSFHCERNINTTMKILASLMHRHRAYFVNIFWINSRILIPSWARWRRWVGIH